MISPGVLAFPVNASAFSPFPEIGFWKNLKCPTIQETFSKENRRFEPSGKKCAKADSPNFVNDIRSPTSKTSLYVERTPPRKLIWVKKPIKRAPSIPEPSKLLSHHVTFHQSIYISIPRIFSDTSNDCNDFRADISTSIQTRKITSKDSAIRPRHVEIVVPSSVQQEDHLSANPKSPHIPNHCRQSSASQLLKRSLSQKMSGPGSRTSYTSATESSTKSHQNGQPLLELRDPGTAAFPSFNGSKSRLAESAASSPDQGSFQRVLESLSGHPQPTSETTTTSSAIEVAALGNHAINNLSAIACNVHKTTGKVPPALVGASTTILGDKLYVFGGRRLSRTRPQLTRHLYELDLIRRHWTRLETFGTAPTPRFFHSVCPLGDTKLVCYGGMGPSSAQKNQPTNTSTQSETPRSDSELIVMSDIHVYEISSRTWTAVATADMPRGRYAHCATIVPSFLVFTSATAPLSAIHHNPASSNPNHGSIGVAIDGRGGAEMIVVGGEDQAGSYIEEINVFNLRSLKWTTTNPYSRKSGTYRSVVTPLVGMRASDVGRKRVSTSSQKQQPQEDDTSDDSEPATLIYSNYNFADVKLELKIRQADGTMLQKHVQDAQTPPALRFPSGGVIGGHLLIGGTFITSSKQEYALWALDLRSLKWTRVDTGLGSFSAGSWNRGILCSKLNTFVVLGDEKRILAEDYNERRTNFAHICLIELEAYGLHDDPGTISPGSASESGSVPNRRQTSRVGFLESANLLGCTMMESREFSDMELLALGGERLPVNSRFIAQRWGPYFDRLLRESLNDEQKDSNAGPLRLPDVSHPSRNSTITITPTVRSSFSNATTMVNRNDSNAEQSIFTPKAAVASEAPTESHIQWSTDRPRVLFLPHTHLTISALIYYLYTSALPPTEHHLCTPQILCSLLQLARPYQISGLLEATVARLHQVLDWRNTAAVFNAAAMAAGGGSGVTFVGDETQTSRATDHTVHRRHSLSVRDVARKHNSQINGETEDDLEDEIQSGTSTSTSGVESAGEEADSLEHIWNGDWSGVIGLQKRALRGLMEGKRLRDRATGEDAIVSSIGSLTGHSETAKFGLVVA